MNSETKNCQNCKKDFTIESEDFNFYEKIKVPPPTFCRWCRFIRRMAWRNERALYKRTCDLCKNDMIATHPAGAPFPVYCTPCWYSDKWEADSFGRDYDFSKPFFEQYLELLNSVPRFGLWQRKVINSDYANLTGESKNVYLSFSVVKGCENIFYSKSIDASFNILDSLNIKNSENCYENVEGDRNYNSQYLTMSRNCIDSYYLVDCANCSNCFMSSNLRNRQYYFQNQQYSPEDYETQIEKLNLGNRKSRHKLEKEFNELQKMAMYRYANMVNCIDSTGNNLSNTKNCINCFDVYDAEDVKNSYRTFTSKDSMDFDYGGFNSELMYEYTTGANYDYNVRFSYTANENVRNAEYTYSCINSSDLFGCVGLRNKKYMIFNKAYPKDEYEKLREEIISQMNEMPYIDKKDRIYKYGEFFPFELSPHGYNETAAQEFETLTKEESISRGYAWRDVVEKNFNITIKAENIPDNISQATDEILNEVLGCAHGGECNHQCTKAFRVTQGELQFYKKFDIPLPDKCSNCRYYERFSKVPPPKLYHRQCICNLSNHGHDSVCLNEFSTPYAPGRPERVYCESCYNKEIY